MLNGGFIWKTNQTSDWWWHNGHGRNAVPEGIALPWSFTLELLRELASIPEDLLKVQSLNPRGWWRFTYSLDTSTGRLMEKIKFSVLWKAKLKVTECHIHGHILLYARNKNAFYKELEHLLSVYSTSRNSVKINRKWEHLDQTEKSNYLFKKWLKSDSKCLKAQNSLVTWPK